MQSWQPPSEMCREMENEGWEKRLAPLQRENNKKRSGGRGVSAGWKKVFLGLFTIEISHFTFMQMQQINNEKIIKDGIQMWPKRWGKCSVSGNLRAEKANI